MKPKKERKNRELFPRTQFFPIKRDTSLFKSRRTKTGSSWREDFFIGKGNLVEVGHSS